MVDNLQEWVQEAVRCFSWCAVAWRRKIGPEKKFVL
jgi:hypothetical protein